MSAVLAFLAPNKRSLFVHALVVVCVSGSRIVHIVGVFYGNRHEAEAAGREDIGALKASRKPLSGIFGVGSLLRFDIFEQYLVGQSTATLVALQQVSHVARFRLALEFLFYLLDLFVELYSHLVFGHAAYHGFVDFDEVLIFGSLGGGSLGRRESEHPEID